MGRIKPNKIIGVLQSRKFWAAIITLLMIFGVLEQNEAEQARLVEAILTVVTTVSYIVSVALEDGLSRRA